jgi:hypothetical protein
MATQAGSRARSRRRSKTLLRWYLIILVVVLLLAAVLGLRGGLINFLEEHSNILDDQYIPADLDRRTQDRLQKELKGLDMDKLEELRKKYEDRLRKR